MTFLDLAGLITGAGMLVTSGIILVMFIVAMIGDHD